MRLPAAFFRLAWYVFIVLTVSLASAGTRDPDTPDEKYVEFGKKFENVQVFKGVIDIQIVDKDNAIFTEQYGSCVIIKPHWVLTAAHMVTDDGKEVKAVSVIKDGKEYNLPYFIRHPEHDLNDDTKNDIALCYSEQEIPCKFYPELYRQADERNKLSTIAGYGWHGTFETGMTDLDGKKRGGHNRIDDVQENHLLCLPTKGPDKRPLEFLITQGDSGGGLFIGNKLAGINSLLFVPDGVPDGTYTDIAAFTRISLVADWIDAEIEKYERRITGKITLAPDVNKK